MLHQDFRKSGKAMKALLLSVLLLHLGYYMILPILPIYLKLNKGMGIAEIGIILAVIAFSFQGASVLGGFLADRFGRRTIIALGAIIRAGAFVGYAIFQPFWAIIAMSFFNGVGGGLNAPSTKAAIAALASSDENKTTAFSLRGIAANIGTSLAGLMTYFVLGGSSALIFYVAAGLFTVQGIITWFYVPKNCGEEPCPIIPAKSYLQILKNKPFVVFSLVNVLIWALYTQFALAVPLRAAAILSDPGMVSLIWTINSIIVILLQAPISAWLLNRIHAMYALALGIIFVGAGISSLYWTTSFYGLAISGVIFIFGEMLIAPTVDSTVSRFATAQIIGVFFGLANFISSLGEGAGNYAGGQLLSFGTTSPIPWTVYGVSAVFISLLLVALRLWHPIQLALEDKQQSTLKKKEGMEMTVSLRDWIYRSKKRAK
jgi:MFS family permease